MLIFKNSTSGTVNVNMKLNLAGPGKKPLTAVEQHKKQIDRRRSMSQTGKVEPNETKPFYISL